MIKSKKKIIGISVFFIAITLVFFCYKPIITYDTSHYIYLKEILTGVESFSNWDNVRGISFPFSIAIFEMIFGKNLFSLSAFTYAYYIAMIIISIMIYIKVINNVDFGKKIKILAIFLYVLFVLINPIIFGYYHVLLVEFVGMTIALLSCFLSWEFLNINFKNDKGKYVLYTIIFTILGIMMWHMKQPYFSTVLFPLVFSSIISICKEFKLNNILSKLIGIVIVILGLVTSLIIWNKLMESQNVTIKEEKTSTGLMSEQLIKGISEYEMVSDVTEEYLEKNKYLSEEEKNKIYDLIKKDSDDYLVFENIENAEVVNTKVVFLDNGKISTKDSIFYILETFVKEPGVVIKSYVRNYLALSDILMLKYDDTIKHYRIGEIAPYYMLYENALFAHWPYDGDGSIFLMVNKKYTDYLESYEDINEKILGINDFFYLMRKPANMFYKFVFILLPMLWVLSIIRLIINRKKYSDREKNIYNFIVILYGYSFLHIFMHGFLGAPIDRYAMPATITTYVAIIIEICMIIKDIKLTKKMKEKKNGKNISINSSI